MSVLCAYVLFTLNFLLVAAIKFKLNAHSWINSISMCVTFVEKAYMLAKEIL